MRAMTRGSRASRWSSARSDGLATAALVATAVLLVAASTRRIWGVDFWWQWATGRLVANGHLPRVDVFSYTAAGSPWIELRWLYCFGLYEITSKLGFAAVGVAKVTMLLVSFGLVTASVLERRGRVAAAAAGAVAILTSSQRFFVRPELVTFLMFALFVHVLETHRRRPTRWLYALPALEVVWVNSHTVFVLGPCLLGLMLLVTAVAWLRRRGGDDAEATRRRARELALVLALTCGACLVNPYGLRGALLPLQLFRQIRGTAFKDAIGEFRGPFDFEQHYFALDYYEALIALVAATLLAHLRRVDPFRLGLVLSQLYLSLLAIRNLPLFALAAIPFVVDGAQRSPLLESVRLARLRTVLGHAVALSTIGLCGYQSWALVTDRFNVAQGDTNQFGFGVATSRYPEHAVDFLVEHHLGGPVLHPMAEGSYLLARGFEVYIDPRLEVYGEQRFIAFQRTFADPAAWQSTVDEYRIRVLLLDCRSPVLSMALRSGRFRLVHLDEVAVVLVAAGSGGPPAVDTPAGIAQAVAAVRARLPPVAIDGTPAWWQRARSPAAYERFGLLLVDLHQTAAALPFLRDVARLSPHPGPALANEATACEQLRDFVGAESALERLVAIEPGNSGALYRLATHRARAGDHAGARALLARSLTSDPSAVAAWALQGKVCASLGDSDTAARSLRRAVDLEPRTARHRANLGRVLLNAGRLTEAETALLAALDLAPSDSTLLRDLALTRERGGARAAALDYARRALALAPDDPQLRALVQRLGGS